MKKIILYPKHTVSRKYPKNIQEEHISNFIKEYERVIEDCYLLEVDNVYVTSEGVAFDKLWRQIKESNTIEKFSWRYKLSHILRKKVIKFKDNEMYLLTFDSWGQGYFHWLTDTIQRIAIVGDKIKNYILILPSKLNNFQIESLKIFNFKQTLQIPEGHYVYVPKLLIPTHVAITGNYNEAIIRSIRSMYNNYVKKSNGYGIYRRIYVSRRKANKRFVVNEDAIETILKKYDFDFLCMEDFSFWDQVRLFSSTKYLISIHGAALTNMLFMPEGSKVLEIRKEGDDSNLCYFSLASALGIDYYYQFGRVTNGEKHIHHANLEIDIELFEQNILLLLD